MSGFGHALLSMFKQALISVVLAYGFMARHLIADLMFRADFETGLLVWEHAALAILRVVMLVLSYCGSLRFMKGTFGLEEMNIVVYQVLACKRTGGCCSLLDIYNATFMV